MRARPAARFPARSPMRRRNENASVKASVTKRALFPTTHVSSRSPSRSASPASGSSYLRASVAAPAASASRSTTRRSTAWTTRRTSRRRGGRAAASPKETEIGAVDRPATRAAPFLRGRARVRQRAGRRATGAARRRWRRTSSAPRRRAERADARPLAFGGDVPPEQARRGRRRGGGCERDLEVPRCRGSCGVGCVTCCNCGPCRKAHGLAPTHQVIQLARGAGFDNVHDYLVHGATGLTPAALLARKRSFNWGKWLAKGSSRRRRRRRARAKPRSRRRPRRRPRRRSARAVRAVWRTSPPSSAAAAPPRSRRTPPRTPSAYAPATPSPAKGALVPARKRPWAAAIGAMAETTMPSMPTSRPASPATPEADAGLSGRAPSLARVAPSRAIRGLFPDAPGAVRVAGEGARAVASRQGDIRAMFAAREGARATRARAAGAA